MSKIDHITRLPLRINLEQIGFSHEDIVKGHLIEAFGYSDVKTLPLNKKGKEIIDAMDLAIKAEEMEIVTHLGEAAKYKCEEIPTGTPSQWTLRHYPISSFINLPKLYTWDQKKVHDPHYNENEKSFETSLTASFDKPKSGELDDYKKMNLYNRHAEKVIECMVEIKIAQTIKNGVEEKKTYPLSVKQAAALGL